MLKIRRLKIAIKTKNGKNFGCDFTFNPNGLNIIKAGNHSGKTTCASAIFYALGMEELLGARNTAALDSILTSQVPINNDVNEPIAESKFYLEIQNNKKEILTLKRYSKHLDIDPRIIYISKENIDNFEKDNTKIIPTYVHDPGSAQNTQGFYHYLEKFLNLNLPSVPSYDETETKLYLQVIFNAYFVEQLQGWTDFFGTIPNFNIKEPQKRIVEYILNLDSSTFEKDKAEYEVVKNRLISSWKDYLQQIIYSIKDSPFKFNNSFSLPVSKDKLSNELPSITFTDNEKKENYDIKSYIQHTKKEISELEIKIQTPSTQNEKKLFTIRSELKKIARKISQLNSIIDLKDNELKKSNDELNFLEKEISNLTDLIKIKNYTNDGSVISQIAEGKCPTCKQEVDKSFHSKIQIMGVEENKDYLVAQKQILNHYINSLEDETLKQKELINFLENEYKEKRDIIEYLEDDIQYNSNMTSYKKIVDLKTKFKSYEKIESQFFTTIKELKLLSKEWSDNELKNTTYQMSFNDKSKLDTLQSYVRDLMFDFGYGSKKKEQVLISRQAIQKYLPVISIENKNEKIRLNSSASDFVRTLWAYYLGLYLVSKKYKGNHLGLFLFDEPAQHAMNESSQKALLEFLASIGEGQSLIFSSFEDKDKNPIGKEKFSNMIKNIDKDKINIIQIDNYAIEEILSV